MTTQHRSLARGAAALAAAALISTGCSSTKSTPTAQGTSSTTPATIVTTTASSTAPAGGGPTDTAAATQAVKTLWTTYYDSTGDPAKKAALVQNPAKMAPLLTQLLAKAAGGKSSAIVDSVTFDSPTHANVTFAIQLNGTTVIPSVNGQAILDPATGQWQVADITLCQLASLAGVDAATLSGAGCS
jgi:hypothetical protein